MLVLVLVLVSGCAASAAAAGGGAAAGAGAATAGDVGGAVDDVSDEKKSKLTCACLFLIKVERALEKPGKAFNISLATEISESNSSCNCNCKEEEEEFSRFCSETKLRKVHMCVFNKGNKSDEESEDEDEDFDM